MGLPCADGQFGVADWWPHTVEPGRFLDPSRHFIVCANILGSHYGTTGPLQVNPATGSPWYGTFPPFTIRDMVALGSVVEADSLDDLAKKTGMDAAS